MARLPAEFDLRAETTNKPANERAWMPLSLHHLTVVNLVGDATTDFVLNAPVEITGKLEINVLRDHDGRIGCIFRTGDPSRSR